jgi:hypothetical protein
VNPAASASSLRKKMSNLIQPAFRIPEENKKKLDAYVHAQENTL